MYVFHQTEKLRSGLFTYKNSRVSNSLQTSCPNEYLLSIISECLRCEEGTIEKSGRNIFFLNAREDNASRILARKRIKKDYTLILREIPVFQFLNGLATTNWIK
jgi:hypothetical protein